MLAVGSTSSANQVLGCNARSHSIKMGDMINISHPKIHGKPPVKKYPKKPDENAKYDQTKVASILESAEDASRRKVGDVETPGIAPRRRKSPDEKEAYTMNDYNQNIIDSTSCSFEQLCTMITDLEKNVATEVPEVNRFVETTRYNSNGCPMLEEKYIAQLEPERDTTKTKGDLNGTTYDEIMSFLGNLEEGIEGTGANVSELGTPIFQEIFNDVRPSTCVSYVSSSKIESRIPRAFEDDLATARLQLEEKEATVAMLKNQLKTERRSACEKLESQKKNDASKLHAQKEKYEGIIKRHQKFIEQLISEKRNLTEKCNSLAQRLKELEIKIQRDLKATNERHAVELQRAKERYAAAEKIKRERWLEARTLKIKEMTVKGLEPELRNMVEQHEEEIQKLRSAHIKELQDAELRLVRRCNQQLEQLRLELTASHDQMLTNEKNALWSRYKEKLEELETQFQARHSKLLDELHREKATLDKEQARHEAEKDAVLQRAHMQHQEEMEALKQRHVTEKRTLEETLKGEWEAWLVDYKRQQVIKMEKAENKIRVGCVKERDRQIEVAIEQLEKDSREMKESLQQNYDGKLRSLKDKFEMELQTAKDNEKLQHDKLSATKERLDKVESDLQKCEKRLQECMCDLKSANELTERVTSERDNAKRTARQEIEVEKRELEEKIASLYREIADNNCNRDAALAQLQSRIKLVMTQKVLAIRNLTKELSDAKMRCEHLDQLLDQQRKEYILKSL